MDIEGMDYDLLKDLLDNVICANCAPFPLDQVWFAPYTSRKLARDL